MEEKLFKSQLRTEILTLISSLRTKKQLLFAFESLLADGLDDAMKYFIGMLRASHSNDYELIKEIEEKYNNYKRSINNV